MLIPRQVDQETLDIDDPRIDLVSQLIEYKKYKTVAHKLKNLHFENKNIFFRSTANVIYDKSHNVSDYLNEVTLFDISKIFKEAIDNAPSQDTYEIYKELVSLKDQKNYIFSIRLIKNSFYTGLALAFVGITPFTFNFLVARTFGKETLGSINLILSFCLFITIFITN